MVQHSTPVPRTAACCTAGWFQPTTAPAAAIIASCGGQQPRRGRIMRGHGGLRRLSGSPSAGPSPLAGRRWERSAVYSHSTGRHFLTTAAGVALEGLLIGRIAVPLGIPGLLGAVRGGVGLPRGAGGFLIAGTVLLLAWTAGGPAARL